MSSTQPFDNRRNQLQILADILTLCMTPQSKTQVLYRTNTNSKLLEKYLDQLQKSRLLKTLQGGKRFATTPKGLEFVQTWNKLQGLIHPRRRASTVTADKRGFGQEALVVNES